MAHGAEVTRGGYRERHDAAADGMRRVHRVQVPMSDAERDALEAAADGVGEGMAEFARAAIAERIERE